MLSREKGGALVLRTEMRDTEADSLRLSFDPNAGGFEIAPEAGTAAAPEARSPKDLTPWAVLQMTKAEMERGEKGLTVKQLQLLAACADGTARVAIAGAIKAKVLKEEGPANGRWSLPAA